MATVDCGGVEKVKLFGIKIFYLLIIKNLSNWKSTFLASSHLKSPLCLEHWLSMARIWSLEKPSSNLAWDMGQGQEQEMGAEG